MGHLLQNISFTFIYPLLHTLTTEQFKTQILQKLEFKIEETQTVKLSTKFCLSLCGKARKWWSNTKNRSLLI